LPATRNELPSLVEDTIDNPWSFILSVSEAKDRDSPKIFNQDMTFTKYLTKIFFTKYTFYKDMTFTKYLTKIFFHKMHLKSSDKSNEE
jgi:hypothetical protein